jgi:hypothetical protein
MGSYDMCSYNFGDQHVVVPTKAMLNRQRVSADILSINHHRGDPMPALAALLQTLPIDRLRIANAALQDM